MARIALLLALAVAVYLAARGYKRLDAAARKRLRFSAALGLAGAGVLALVVTGRMHWLVAPALVLLRLVWRLLPLLQRLWVHMQGTPSDRGHAHARSAAGSDAMTPQRAREILDVSAEADSHEIIAAHRRLVSKLHPDTGGSTYLAAQINQARDVLLRRGI